MTPRARPRGPRALRAPEWLRLLVLLAAGEQDVDALSRLADVPRAHVAPLTARLRQHGLLEGRAKDTDMRVTSAAVRVLREAGWRP